MGTQTRCRRADGGRPACSAAPASAQSPAELAAMKAEYRRPAALPVENRALADLGRLLFWDPRVSASGNTACASCHLPDRGWSVAEAKSRNDSGKLTVAQVAALVGMGHVAKRHAVRLGRPQPDARGAGQELGRDRRDVGARDRKSGQGGSRSSSVFATSRNTSSGSRRRCPAPPSRSTRSRRRSPPSSAPWSPGRRRSIAGSRATKPRSRTPRSAASCCSTARPRALPVIPAGASPTTSFTTSAFPRATAAAARR